MKRPGTTICCYSGPIGGHADGLAAAHTSRGRSFVNRPGWEEFQSILEGLRARCPPAMPVVVRTSWLPETRLGQCRRHPKRFVIQLNRYMEEPQAIEVLCHEWAHALAWNYSLDWLAKQPNLDPAEFQRQCHDEAWGCAFSRVYRASLAITDDEV